MEEGYSVNEYFHKQPEVQHIFDALAPQMKLVRQKLGAS